MTIINFLRLLLPPFCRREPCSPALPQGLRSLWRPQPGPAPAAAPSPGQRCRGGEGKRTKTRPLLHKSADPARPSRFTVGGTYRDLHLLRNASLRLLWMCPLGGNGPGCPQFVLEQRSFQKAANLQPLGFPFPVEMLRS